MLTLGTLLFSVPVELEAIAAIRNLSVSPSSGPAGSSVLVSFEGNTAANVAFNYSIGFSADTTAFADPVDRWSQGNNLGACPNVGVWGFTQGASPAWQALNIMVTVPASFACGQILVLAGENGIGSWSTGLCAFETLASVSFGCGTLTLTATATNTPSHTPTTTPSMTPTLTPGASVSATSSPTFSSTPSVTPDPVSTPTAVAVSVATPAPNAPAVSPNPFTPSLPTNSEVFFNVPAAHQGAELLIYDLRRRVIKKIQTPPGQAVTWNGKDENGVTVLFGVYPYILRVDGKTLSGTVTVIR